eukprot:Opistho-2@68046
MCNWVLFRFFVVHGLCNKQRYNGQKGNYRYYRTWFVRRCADRMYVSGHAQTGTPYLLYKDACNDKSNQKNLGTIKCSNLCTEIIEYTSPDEVCLCRLQCTCQCSLCLWSVRCEVRLCTS